MPPGPVPDDRDRIEIVHPGAAEGAVGGGKASRPDEVRFDAEAGRAIYQSFARYRPVEAVDAAVEEEQEPESSETPVYDIETPEGLQTLKRILKRIEPVDAFATIRPGRDGRATARILRRSSRRVIAAAIGADESTLRGVIREILPNVMLDVAMKPPG